MGENATLFLLLVLYSLSILIPTTTSPPPPLTPTFPPLSTTSSPPCTTTIHPPLPSPLSTTSSPPLKTTIPPPPPSPLPPKPPPPSKEDINTRLQQIYNILDALIGSGDFGNWINILSAADPSMFPISATLFIPDAAAFSLSPHRSLDPLLFPYHIVPQRLTFSDLLLFKTNTRIPTLLPNCSILITNRSPLNFTLDGSPLTRPDLFANDDIVVHGIGRVLDYTVYGQESAAASTSSVSAPAPHARNVGGSPTVPFWPMEETRQASCGDCLGSKSHLVSFILVTFWFFKHSRLLGS